MRPCCISGAHGEITALVMHLNGITNGPFTILPRGPLQLRAPGYNLLLSQGGSTDTAGHFPVPGPDREPGAGAPARSGPDRIQRPFGPAEIVHNTINAACASLDALRRKSLRSPALALAVQLPPIASA